MKTINIVADGRRRCEDVGNAHAPGVYCAPSRTAIFTGRYASTTGCYRNEIHYDDHPDLVPLQTAFHRSGNATFGSGRLVHHREGYPDRSGWDEFFVRNDTLKQKGWRIETWPMAEDERDVPFPDPFPASIDNKGREVTGGLFLEWGSIPNDREKEMADTRRVNDACEVLKREHDKPFFPAVGLYATEPANRPLRVLFMACSPHDVRPVLDYEQEEAHILETTRRQGIELVVEDSGSRGATAAVSVECGRESGAARWIGAGPRLPRSTAITTRIHRLQALLFFF